MSGISETIEIAPADRRKLDRAIDKMGDTLPLMESIATAVKDQTVNRFREQRAPDGKPWKPSLRAQLTGAPTLVDSQNLLNRIDQRSSADQAEVGTDVIYAAIHQFGGVIRAKGAGGLKFSLPGGGFANVQSVTMPARPFLGLNQQNEGAISRIVQRFIDQAATA